MVEATAVRSVCPVEGVTQMIEARYGTPEDREWLADRDDCVTARWVDRCLSHGEYVVAQEQGRLVGFLRFSFFWGNIPYMEMIRVDEGDRGRGVGTRLVGFWSEEMDRRGAQVLLTSATADEPEARAWHERNGFVECGWLALAQYQAAPEVFFARNL